MLLKMMIMKKPISCYFLFKIKRAVTSCALPIDPSDVAVSPVSGNHKCLSLSLVEQLIQRGLISSAQQVIQRMIKTSTSVSDAISIADSAISHGLSLNLGSYDTLIRKLVALGEPQLAVSIYLIEIKSRDIFPGPSILNYMVVSLCKLGKLEEAINCFDRLLSFNCPPYKVACDCIIQECCAQERFLDAFNCFLGAQYTRAQLSFWCYSLLIDGLCHRGHLEEALHVFDILRNCDRHLPSVHICKSLFYGFCKRGRVVEAEFIYGEMESRGMFIDRTMYTSLIHEYCKTRKMKMATRVFFRMLKTGCEPDRYLCNTLIYGFVRLSLYDKGWIIYNKMMEWGIKPNVVTYQIMISQYCREEKNDCALELFHNMINSNLAPNAHCYTVLISAMYKQNEIEKTCELYQIMMEAGVVPDHVLFFKLMRIFPVCKLQLAFTLLQLIAKNGCGFDSSMMPASSSHDPTHDLEQETELLLERIATKNINLAQAAYSIFISALCEEGKIDKALFCLSKTEDAGFRPLQFCYNSVIKCLSRLGHFEDANFVIDLMEDHGLVPDQTTYLMIINELCNRGDLVSAYGFLDQMEERGIEPSVAIYDSVIGCLCKKGRIFDAEDMFKRMLQSGVDPDEAVYTTMINGYSMNGRVLEACQLFDIMIKNSIKPGSRSYTSIITGLVKKNMIDKGCVYLGRMLEDGLLPTAVLYTSLIKHFLKSRDFGFAFKLVNLAGKNDIKWDLVMEIELVNGICRYISGIENKKCLLPKQSERAKEMLLRLLHQNPFSPPENNIGVSANSFEAMKRMATKLVENIKGVPVVPNIHANNCIILWFCREEMIHEAYNHFHLMQNEGVCPNKVTYTILLDGHIRLDDIDSAVRLFNEMNVVGCAPDRTAYNTLLKGFIRAGRLLDAMSLTSGLSVYSYRIFQEMVARNYRPFLYDCRRFPFELQESNRLHEYHMVLDMTFQIALDKVEEITLGIKEKWSFAAFYGLYYHDSQVTMSIKQAFEAAIRAVHMLLQGNI
ncbi:pentatricopeptide repeat-containing protein [Senna tora]|uniref:Pentatricopeptide repeat-containing protein n=1 Tax=Senna tora TaxID=362788 RepID=A0A834X2I4_9FABA|nr:pentatricopeptide repeat-containing protein [Senna tora]KAF7836367.1 pentatricopeptide repeat-containing protein [Senna tora]